MLIIPSLVNSKLAVKIEARPLFFDFTDLLNYHDTNNQELDRNSCNINVACAEADPYVDQVNSVMLMTMGGGSCSASLINNVEEDLTKTDLESNVVASK